MPPATGTRERVWCSDRCRKAASRRAPSNGHGDAQDLEPAGSILEALEVFLATVNYPASDPRAVVAEVSRRLAAELDRSPSASIARELGLHLHNLASNPNEDAGFVDVLQARRAQRRVETVISTARRAGDGS